MVEPAQDRRGDHLRVCGKPITGARDLIRVRDRLWNAWSEAGVWATAIVVGHPFAKDQAEMSLVNGDQPIQTLAADAADYYRGWPEIYCRALAQLAVRALQAICGSTCRSAFSMLAFDEELDALSSLDARQCRVVELRFFAGLNIPETADALGVSTATIEREWAMAKAWLRRRLSTPPGAPPDRVAGT